MAGILGVFADDNTSTLWACSGSIGRGSVDTKSSALYAFHLETGAYKRTWALPTAGGLCNDIALDRDGNIYVTDTVNMELLRLKKGGNALEVWAGDGAFGRKGGMLDGLAVLGNRLVVNTLATSKLFSVPIEQDGSAGTVAEIKLDTAVERPDGMRSFGNNSLLIAEGGGNGRLTKVELNGNNGSRTVLREGFPDGPVAVTVVGATAYVLEGQLSSMKEASRNTPSKPYKATAVEVGGPP